MYTLLSLLVNIRHLWRFPKSWGYWYPNGTQLLAAFLPSSVSPGRPRHQVASKTWRGDELKNFLRGRREGEPEKPFET